MVSATVRFPTVIVWLMFWTPISKTIMAGYPIFHYGDVIMGPIATQITSLTIVYSIVYSDEDQRKHQSSASLAFVWGIHRGPVNSPHKWRVTRKMFPFDDVIMHSCYLNLSVQAAHEEISRFSCCCVRHFKKSWALLRTWLTRDWDMDK